MWFFLLLFCLMSEETVSNRCLNPFLTEPEFSICYQMFSFYNQTKTIIVPKGTPKYLGDVNPDGSRRYPPGVREAQLAQMNQPAKRRKRQTHPAGTIYDCMDIPCICGYLNGLMLTKTMCKLSDGGIYRKVVRKEIRMMTQSEINKFAQAFWAVRPTIYWILSGFHSNATSSPGAHSGPNFLGWHREFLKRLEIGMRTYKGPLNTYPYIDVALPYWDSSMDHDIYNFLNPGLPLAPTASVMFSSYLLGSVNTGIVTDGFFANWQGTISYVFRELNRFPTTTFLFRRTDVDSVINDPEINNILVSPVGMSPPCPYVPYDFLEFGHGQVHIWVGGNMKITLQATNDPIFFFHHCFVDFIWEQWRIKNQDRYQRETQWNTGNETICYAPGHMKLAVMLPFLGRVNQDGLSNMYTDFLYSYQLRPTCSSTVSCGSPYLWCHISSGRCVSRIKLNSRCTIISGVDPCFQSVCIGNYCKSQGVAPNPNPPGTA